MADLAYNNKVLTNDEDEQKGHGTGVDQNALSSNGSSGLVTGGTGGVNTAGVGAGGTGSWTNIQSYLSANQGGTGSEKLLQDKVGTQFEKERSDIETSGTEAKTKANESVDSVKDASQNARSWVDQAASAYSWDGNNQPAYDANASKVKNALSGQYSGPTSYDYSMSSDTQNYGDAMGNDVGFQNIMNSLYRDASGGQISRGGLDLQAQLDSSNDALAGTRQDLLKDYAGLGDQRKQTATDVGGYLNQARADYGTYQNALKDDLSNYANDRSTAISKAEADARKSYINSYENTFFDQPLYEYQGGNAATQLRDLKRSGIDSYSEIQNYFDSPTGRETLNYLENAGPSSAEFLPQVFDPIDQFYGSQRELYKNTGDMEKKQFNTIMDILGLNGTQTQGFDAVQRSKDARGKE